jgi:glycosyltransferase involved in cell wall biosynthesis
LEELIVGHGVDLVYTNTLTCIEGAIAALRTRKPHVWHIHECILSNFDLMPLLPYRLLCAAVGFLSQSIIFCSRTAVRDYPALSGKASIVYNGLSVSPLQDRRAARSKAERELGIEAGTKIVAVVGALAPHKDHLTFLAAAERVERRVDKAFFLIVGAGSERYTQTIRRRIADLRLDSQVRLLGWRNDIQDLLAAIDVLVISSRKESFGLTAIEALAMETPVIATKCGGPAEVMKDGVTGLLVPVKDPLAMADAIESLLLDPNLARRLGENGRNHVSEHFGADRYVHSIQRIIQDTAASKGKS